VAYDAQRPAALAHGVSAVAALAQGQGVRGNGPRPAGTAASGWGQERAAFGAVLDGRTLQSTPESGGGAGYDGYKRKNGSKVHMAVDTLGLLLELLVTPANEQERRQVEALGKAVQRATDNSVTTAFADQGYTGGQAEGDARKAGMKLVVVKPPEAKQGFVLLPDVGWWSAVLPEWPAFAVWPGTSSAPLKCCAGFISSPLPS